MRKSKIFSLFCLSFFIGVIVGFKSTIQINIIYVLLAACLAAFVFAVLKSKKFLKIISVGVIIFLLGILRAQSSMVGNEFSELFEEKQVLEGYILEDPDVRQDKQMLVFKPNNFNQNILINTSLVTTYFYGDQIVFEDKLKLPENFSDFDYKGYLERYNVYALSSYPKILVLRENQLNPIKYYLLKIKAWATEYVSAFLPKPESSLLLGILIGAKKGLPTDITNNFIQTGLSHIVAVSGYNIAILIGMLGGLSKFLGKKYSFWISAILIFCFVIIAGASASVLRAATMGVLLLLSFNFGRLYNFAPAILFSALVMTVVNPKILFSDVGFALSFSATCGIVYGLPVLQELTTEFPEWFGLKSLFLTTISAILVTLPLSLYFFGKISLVAIFANLLVLPVIPVVTILGFLIFVPVLSSGFAFFTYAILVYILKVVELLAKLPWAAVEYKIGLWGLWLTYLFIILCYFLLKNYLKKSKKPIVEQGCLN